jgi:uncharacterized FAD-dependent dehydrogenase
VAYGATPDILVEAHPHIGTNKLFRIFRRENHECGGQVLFETSDRYFSIMKFRIVTQKEIRF